jgi:hypothetical protein
MDRADAEDFNPSLNLQRSVQDLYGLIHARFILTKRGQDKMYRKFREAVFGVCPLLTCEAQAVLPVGLKDDLGEHSVLVYCPRCRQVMVPAVMAASRFEEMELDGAYFGTSFPHLFFMQNPHLLPPPPLQMAQYVPKVFGFAVRFPTEEQRLAEVALAESEMLANAAQQQEMQGLSPDEHNVRIVGINNNDRLMNSVQTNRLMGGNIGVGGGGPPPGLGGGSGKNL